jgi:GNAT superfamily N-acetyltransferase
MACGSHTARSEKQISKVCANPNVTIGLQKNPFVVLRELTAEFSYKMQAVDCDVPGYRMAFDRDQSLLSVFDGEDKVVGGIFHKSILVLPQHRSQGLGSEILIRAFEIGAMYPDTMNQDNRLTTAGRANRKAAHRIAVERAVRAGIDVDPAILACYQHVMDEWTPSPLRI